MDELARLLSRERLVLELVVFRLVELRQLLAAGEARFLPAAAADVEHALADLRTVELRRAVVVNRLAAAAGVADDQLSLRALAGIAPRPYAGILTEHRRALQLLAAEMQATVAACGELSADGAAFVAEVLRQVTDRRGAEHRLAGVPDRPVLVSGS
jgi:hypothetical protein